MAVTSVFVRGYIGRDFLCRRVVQNVPRRNDVFLVLSGVRRPVPQRQRCDAYVFRAFELVEVRFP